ncbi:MAG: hypothetical protein EBZ48_05335 [Proteobacteria bacterium]|nr:hypothetical protein [Pseudomonadota bacterium]
MNQESIPCRFFGGPSMCIIKSSSRLFCMGLSCLLAVHGSALRADEGTAASSARSEISGHSGSSQSETESPGNGPSAKCLAEATAKELGIAARERFLARCQAADKNVFEQDPIVSGGPASPTKLTAAEQARVEHCTTLAAGRKLSGGSRDYFLRDCLSGN